MRLKTGDPIVAEEVLGEEARSIDQEVERRVVRKIDMFLMPAMVIGKLLHSLTTVLTTTNVLSRIWLGVLRQGEPPQ